MTDQPALLPEDQAPAQPADIPVYQQLEEVERELSLRARVYPKWIAGQRMTAAEAERWSDRLRAVRATLRSLVHFGRIIRLGTDGHGSWEATLLTPEGERIELVSKGGDDG